MKPKASAYPGWTRSRHLEVLSRCRYRAPSHTPTSPLHDCIPLYSLHTESRSGLQLAILDEAFSSFQLTFQCRLYWIDAASHVVGKFWLPYTPHRRNPTASIRSSKGGGLWLWKVVLISSSFVHSPACLIHSHLFPSSIYRGSKGTPILPISDKMRKDTFFFPLGSSLPNPFPFTHPSSYKCLEPKHEGRVPMG